MKFINHRIIPVIVLVFLVLWQAAGQSNSTNTLDTSRDGRVVEPDPADDSDSVNGVAVADRPDRLESNEISPEVRQRLGEFKRARDRYLAQQESLRKQALGATDAERDKLRHQLAQLRSEWLQRAREMRREFQERKTELKDKLPGHRELLDDLADEAKSSTFQELRQQQLNEQRPATKPRIGVDP